MALNFNNSTTTSPTATANSSTEIVPVEQYDIVSDQTKMRRELVGTEEIERLTQMVKVDDFNTIIKFGEEVTTELSKGADVVLNSMDVDKLSESSKLLQTLTKIMDSIDVNEIKQEPTGIKKLFTNVEKQINKILHKYNTMGAEIDKIYIELKKFQDDINSSNRYLEAMFESNKNAYGELTKYIMACEQLDSELTEYIQSLKDDYQKTGDGQLQFTISQMEKAQQLVRQRLSAFEMLDATSQQTIIMINEQAYTNYNISNAIETRLMINLPIVKNGIAQAMIAKQQRMQANALKALDEKTNQIYLQNAQTIADNARQSNLLASSTPLEIDTVEQAVQILIQSAADIQSDNENISKQRIENRKRLEAAKAKSDKIFVNALPNQ